MSKIRWPVGRVEIEKKKKGGGGRGVGVGYKAEQKKKHIFRLKLYYMSSSSSIYASTYPPTLPTYCKLAKWAGG